MMISKLILCIALSTPAASERVVEGAMESDVQLNNDAAGVCSAIEPCIVSMGEGKACVAWRDYSAGSWQVRVRRSTDWGVTWARETLLSGAGDAYNLQLVSNDAEKLIALWEGFAGASEGGVWESDWAIYARSSPDGGSTWQGEPVRLDSGPEWSGFAQIAMDRKGNAYAAWCEGVGDAERIVTRHSLDRGMTWSNAVMVGVPLKSGEGFEGLRIACDSSGRVYLVAVSAATGGSKLCFFVSSDCGADWREQTTPLTGAFSWPTLSCDEDGTVLLGGMTPDFILSLVVGREGGRKWPDAPVRINASEKFKATLSFPPSVALDGAGRIAVAVVDNRDGGVHGYLHMSEDNGATWSAPVMFQKSNPATSVGSKTKKIPFRCDPAVLWGSDGTLTVAWQDPQYGYLDVFLNRSTDGGKTWLKEPVRLNASPPGAGGSRNLAVAELSPGVIGAVWDDPWRGKGARSVYFNRYSTVRQPPPAAEAPPEPKPALNPPTDLVLENEYVALNFERVGTQLYLKSVLPKESGKPIRLSRGAGDWEVVFRAKKLFDMSVSVDSTGASCSMLVLERLDVKEGLIRTRWGGLTELEGNPLGFVVETEWTLARAARVAETAVEVRITNPGDVPFYTSEVVYPRLLVGPLNEPDDVVIPLGAGYLLRQPFEGVTGRRPIGGPLCEPGQFATPVVAYYGERSHSCLYLANTDLRGWYKKYEIARSPNRLDFQIRHFPEDAFNRKEASFGYRVQVGGLVGDWVDAAQEYRRYFIANAPFYRGPVGAPENPLPEAMKRMVASMHQGVVSDGDAIDAMARDLIQMTRILGPGLRGRWYNCNWPDRFDGFYDLGYLPGKPSFHSAAREAQRRGDIVAAPYIQGSAALYYPMEIKRIKHPTAVNIGTYMSTMIYENGEKMLVRNFAHPMSMVCPASKWWSDYMPATVAEVVAKTGVAGIYVDYFQWSAPCYAKHHGHPPGGGCHHVQGKLKLIKSIRERVAALSDGPGYLAVSSEATGGVAYTEECHLMFRDPLRGGLGDASRGLVSIPLFRMVCDNIKMSIITGVLGEYGKGQGFACWEMMNRVLTFGQVPGFGSSLGDFVEGLGHGRLRPHIYYMAACTSFLRDRGFFKYHNGTLVRTPEVTVANAEDLKAIVENLNYATAAGPRVLPYYTSPVNVGMYRAPNGDYALAATNPWVDQQNRQLDVTVRLNPSGYGDFPNNPKCIFHPDAATSRDVMCEGEEVTLHARLAPGQIAYWEWLR